MAFPCDKTRCDRNLGPASPAASTSPSVPCKIGGYTGCSSFFFLIFFFCHYQRFSPVAAAFFLSQSMTTRFRYLWSGDVPNQRLTRSPIREDAPHVFDISERVVTNQAQEPQNRIAAGGPRLGAKVSGIIRTSNPREFYLFPVEVLVVDDQCGPYRAARSMPRKRSQKKPGYRFQMRWVF